MSTKYVEVFRDGDSRDWIVGVFNAADHDLDPQPFDHVDQTGFTFAAAVVCLIRAAHRHQIPGVIRRDARTKTPWSSPF